MQSGIIVILVVGVASVLCVDACVGDDCELTATCSGPLGTSPASDAGATEDAADADAGRVYPPVPPPPGCVPSEDPTVATACIDETYALFVDGDSGDDLNPGTKGKPLRSIGAATNIDTLAGRGRIYVTSAAQKGSFVLPPNVTLVGGVDRTTWKPTAGQITKLTTDTPGALVRVVGSAAGAQITDFDLTPAAGTQLGDSSIGVEVISSNVTFRRVAIHAQDGMRGAVAPTADNHRKETGEGQPGEEGKGGVGPACTCKIHGSTNGGPGGAPGQPGGDGTSDPPANPSGGKTSKGGAVPACGAGANGADGAPGPGGAVGTVVGHMTANGWTPSNGAEGAYGAPGAGGGGGAGGTTTGGGSGGCGGCGGAGGMGGGAGGSSIGIAAFESDLILSDTTIETKTAGNGEKGGGGQAGEAGAPGSSTGSCTGGTGGSGAGGSGGAGGAGGISVPIVRFHGSVTKVGTVTLTPGTHGSAGGGGIHGAAASSGLPGNDGFGGTALTTKTDDLELSE